MASPPRRYCPALACRTAFTGMGKPSRQRREHIWPRAGLTSLNLAIFTDWLAEQHSIDTTVSGSADGRGIVWEAYRASQAELGELVICKRKGAGLSRGLGISTRDQSPHSTASETNEIISLYYNHLLSVLTQTKRSCYQSDSKFTFWSLS